MLRTPERTMLSHAPKRASAWTSLTIAGGPLLGDGPGQAPRNEQVADARVAWRSPRDRARRRHAAGRWRRPRAAPTLNARSSTSSRRSPKEIGGGEGAMDVVEQPQSRRRVGAGDRTVENVGRWPERGGRPVVDVGRGCCESQTRWPAHPPLSRRGARPDAHHIAAALQHLGSASPGPVTSVPFTERDPR